MFNNISRHYDAYIDIVFPNECEDEADQAIYGCQSISTDETDAFFQALVVPRQEKTLTLDEDSQRRGALVVACAAYRFCLLCLPRGRGDA